MTETELDPRLLEEGLEAAAEEAAHRAIDREVDYERIKRWVILRDGKPYVQYVGLVDLLHQVSGGKFSITTQLVQAPTKENGETAIVSAVAGIMAEDDPGGLAPLYRTASGIGDANASNVTRMMASAIIRMAETRAKGRALRDLLNVALVTVEELPPAESEPSAARRPVQNQQASSRDDRHPLPDNGNGIVHPGAQDTITVEGTEFTRQQVWKAYTQRMAQAREHQVAYPNPVLNNGAPLKALVAATQTIKGNLAKAGKLVPQPAAAD